ncbi:MAG: RNA-binding S4 domain-containing protein [Bacteroidales bacterium]|nr:RNA-binding S4 domain-containing protein [Bacteroidales bacterium]
MKNLTFQLTDDYIELIKLLKAMGIAENGAHAKQLVENGEVKVNNVPEFRKRCKIRQGDSVILKDIKIDITR